MAGRATPSPKVSGLEGQSRQEGVGGEGGGHDTTIQHDNDKNNKHKTHKQNHRVHQEHTNSTMGTVRSQNRAKRVRGRGRLR